MNILSFIVLLCIRLNNFLIIIENNDIIFALAAFIGKTFGFLIIIYVVILFINKIFKNKYIKKDDNGEGGLE